ncbi:unnamed protein product [Rhodiola kirilowii]
MPSKKKSLSEVANATSKGPMKLRSPSSRKPARIHTPEPALKRGGPAKENHKKAAAKRPATTVTQPQEKPPSKPPSNKQPATEQPPDIVVPTELERPTRETAIHATPKKKSIQLQIRRSPRNSSKLRVQKPSNTETETLNVHPLTSKYPARTLSTSSLQRSTASDLYPSLTPSPQVSDKEDDDDDADKEDDFAYEMAEDNNVADKEDDAADKEVDPEVYRGASKEAEGVEFSDQNVEANNTEEKEDEEPD